MLLLFLFMPMYEDTKGEIWIRKSKKDDKIQYLKDKKRDRQRSTKHYIEKQTDEHKPEDY
jgi:hypothetical protein